MKSIKTKIKKSDIKALLLLFPFIEVHVFNVGPVYDIAIAVVSLFVIYLIINNKVVLRKNYLPLLIYLFWLPLCCILNNRSFIPGLFYALKLFSFTQIIEYYLQKKNFRILYIARTYIGFCLIITTFFQFVSQDLFGHLDVSGNYNNFSFGDNVLGYYYIPFIALCIVIDCIEGKKMSKYTLVMILIAIASLFKAWSAKSVLGIALVVVYILFIYGKKIARIFSPILLTVIYIFIEVGLVFFNIQEKFSYLIENILHKDVTLTGRVGIWRNLMTYIKQSPIYGYGVKNGGNIVLATTYVGKTAHAAHNLILELLAQGGIIGLCLWSLFVFRSIFIKRKSIKENYSAYYMLVFFTFVILIMQLSSGSIYIAFQYLPLILCANVDKIFTKEGIHESRNSY